MQTLVLSRATARRFLIRSFALDGFQTLPDVAAALARLEFVQEDSIQICGRMHDLILWPRVADYAPERLADALYNAATPAGFEHYFPNLCVLPLTDYPLFRPAMHRRATTPGRWHKLTDDEERVAAELLGKIGSDGPLRPRHIGTDHGHTTSGWGPRRTVAAHVAEKLWLQGRLAICRRENFERIFDLAERVHPDALALPDHESEHIAPTLARKRLRSRRLFRPNTADRTALGTEAFVKLQIEGVAKPWFALAEDLPALEAAVSAAPSTETHLLAPLDPLVYDRQRTADLFDFDYRWEVYTPVHKRVRGYYALPILQGERIVGWVDPKRDSKKKVLEICGEHLEPDADRGAYETRLLQFAAFLGMEAVRNSPGAA